MSSVDCTTQISGELYGLGIRLGLYLHWVALLILHVSGRGSWSSLSRIRDCNSLICVAIFTKLVVNIAQSNSLAPDFLITFYLLVVLFLHDGYNLFDKRNEPISDGGFWYILQPDEALILQNVLCFAISILGTWFWITRSHHVQPTRCGTKAALIGVFDMHNSSWRAFATAFAIISVLAYFMLFYLHIRNYCKHKRWWFHTVPVQDTALRSPGKNINVQPGSFPHLKVELLGLALRPRMSDSIRRFRRNRRESGQIFKAIRVAGLSVFHLLAVNLVSPIIAIVSVERMIQANHLQPSPISESTGQILALIIGIANLAAVLWEIASELQASHLRSMYGQSHAKRLHAYYSSEPLDEEEFREVLCGQLRSLRLYKPDLAPWADLLSDPLDSVLRGTLIHDLGTRVRLTARNGCLDAVDRYLDIKKLEDLYISGSNVVSFQGTALILAARDGHLEAVQRLLNDIMEAETSKEFHFKPYEGDDVIVQLPIPSLTDNLEQGLKTIESARWWARRAGGQSELAELLEEYSDFLKDHKAQASGLVGEDSKVSSTPCITGSETEDKDEKEEAV